MLRYILHFVAAAAVVTACRSPGSTAGSGPSPGASGPPASLVARNHAFLEEVRYHDLPRLGAFFPESGSLTYVHVDHLSRGDSVSIKVFSPSEARAALERGPLWDAFIVQYEEQVVGLLGHQVQVRGSRWQWVSGTRFVPPGAEASSPAFVEWRREGRRWVLSAFGDEAFGDGSAGPVWLTRQEPAHR